MQFVKHKNTRKTRKLSKKIQKKVRVMKKMPIVSFFSKFIRNFAEYASFYKGTL